MIGVRETDGTMTDEDIWTQLLDDEELEAMDAARTPDVPAKD